jgi:hypothetical protein
MQAHKCGHCGGGELEWKSDTDVVCLHCRTRYRKVPKAQPKVVISKGANVVFGPNAKVTVRGGMEIEEGANVRVEGDLEFELEIVELGDGERGD